jgi:hypothetical protein
VPGDPATNGGAPIDFDLLDNSGTTSAPRWSKSTSNERR